jgi:5-formyltetrahydrofolate cyclo-ligase
MAPQAESKTALRAAMHQRLAGLTSEERAEAAARVASRVLALPETAAADLVLCCLSFGDELDTRRLIASLIAAGKRVCIPRCVAARRELTLHLYPCPLETLRFGLEQPRADAAAVDPAQVHLALIVGLAFDARGYRLGHGAGYFDRFLAAHPLPAVGLGHDFQRLDRLPVEAHDVALAAIVTPSALWRAKG